MEIYEAFVLGVGTMNSVKRYNLVIKTLSPVHIGDGSEVGKKEFVLDRNLAIIPDMRKLYDYCKQRRLGDRFVNFMQDNRPLFFFFRENGIQKNDYQRFISYTAGWEGNERPAAFKSFIKDSYGCPYVPGSSVKGALRTALLAAVLSKEQGPRFKEIYSKSDNRQVARTIEETAFGSINKSIFRGLRVSDSQPLDKSGLILCRKIDAGVDGRENALNIYRECIKPGTIISCRVDIDENIIGLSAEDIEKAVHSFSKIYLDCFLSRYRKFIPESQRNKTMLLGGGTGFVSKTFIYPLFGYEEGLKKTSVFLSRKFPKHHHTEDVRLGASPHTLKLTRYRETPVEMGLCSASFNEIKS